MKYTIRLDICTLCNLNCPACTMRQLDYGKLGAGYTKFETFKKFIDNHKNRIKRIEISSAGEPFLNPDVSKILEYAYENNIEITCKNASNFNCFDDEKIKAVVDYKVTDLVFACDGATQENYQKYRRNGDINKVFDTVKKIQEYKKLVGSDLPKLTWQYIIRESTESKEEIELAKKIAKELDVPIYFKLTYEENYIPKNKDELKQLTGLEFVSRNEASENGKLPFVETKCRQLWSFPTINWDGKLLGCCFNREPFDVNVFEVGLDEALQNKDYHIAKDYVSGKIENDNSNSCMRCNYGIITHNLKLLDDAWLEKHSLEKYLKG